MGHQEQLVRPSDGRSEVRGIALSLAYDAGKEFSAVPDSVVIGFDERFSYFFSGPYHLSYYDKGISSVVGIKDFDAVWHVREENVLASIERVLEYRNTENKGIGLICDSAVYELIKDKLAQVDEGYFWMAAPNGGEVEVHVPSKTTQIGVIPTAE